MLTPRQLVEQYLKHGYRLVFWPANGDQKGPKEAGWTSKVYTLDDYKDGYRVGAVTGAEIEPGKFLVDVDIDWTPGSLVAQNLLPPTGFVYGRSSKRVSHCFYTLPETVPTVRYEDIDKTVLLELRGTTSSGSLGMQSMVPPSVWSKDKKNEPLAFVKSDKPAHLETAQLKHRVTLAAIGMLLSKHFGKNGFGHEPRLAWAGYMLRAGVPVDDLIAMGEAISIHCNNQELKDVRLVVESTASRLASDAKKIKGGPALAKLMGEKGKAIIARINEWLGLDADFARNSEGQIVKDSQRNIKRAITLLGHELSYDEFADKILLDRAKPLEDREVNDLWLRIDEDYHFRPTFMFFEKVIKRLAWDNSFHPVKDYIASLQWDGEPRIDTWLRDYAGAEDSEYLRAVSSIVLIAAIRRIRTPGCKYDELLVLEGEQGLNKSSALRALCPRSDWFSDDLPLNLNSQRMIESTLGKWIIEAADLAGKRKAEVEQLKATLSRQIDGPARLAYAHLPVERKRQFVAIGTTNSAAYLTDPTGARRFWPVRIARFDVQKILDNRDQLWAEAAYRESQGESIRLAEELWPVAAVEQDARREIDPWEGIIRNHLLTIEVSTDGKLRVVTEEIWQALGIQVERRDRYGSMRITEIMQRLGFVRSRVRPRGEAVQVGFVSENVTKLELPDDGGEIDRTTQPPTEEPADTPF
jgi:predicted P-loop ATPase